MNRFVPDPFIPILLGTVALASLFPVSGAAAGQLSMVATAAVMLLFFLHGIKLPRENLMAALVNWRLHLFILGTTYVLFPLLGLALNKLWPSLLPQNLWAGVLSCAHCLPPCRCPSPSLRWRVAMSRRRSPRPQPRTCSASH